MIQVNDLCLQFGGRKLFDEVNLKFTDGNCYGIIGANGAGKSTFLKVLSGDIDPTRGTVGYGKNQRISVLKQNQNDFDDYTVMRTVLMGHKRLVEIMDEKDALYCKEDFTEADGERAAELENEFAEMGGWEAESEAASLLNALKIDEEYHERYMSELDPKLKVKILLAQALFGNPDILILDEPTNHLDLESITALNKGMINFKGSLMFATHDQELMQTVADRIIEIEDTKVFDKLTTYEEYLDTLQ